MKKTLLATALSVFAFSAHADAGYSLGLSYSLNGKSSMSNLGFSAKALTSDEDNEGVGVAGVSLFPWAERKIGLELGAGYNFDHSTAAVTYDFIQAAPQLSYGWTDTHR